MTTAHVAIVISIVALLVSAANLGWSIYKEMGLRARVRVSVAVVEMIGQGKRGQKKILFRAVNMGPGEVHLTSLPLKSARRARKEGGYKWGSLLPEPGGLPVSLPVGKEAHIYVPYEDDCFLRVKHARVGVGDSFGREHWAPKEQLRAAEETYREDFPLGSADSGRGRVKA
jgi:hypothetical protein